MGAVLAALKDALRGKAAHMLARAARGRRVQLQNKDNNRAENEHIVKIAAHLSRSMPEKALDMMKPST